MPAKSVIDLVHETSAMGTHVANNLPTGIFVDFQNHENRHVIRSSQLTTDRRPDASNDQDLQLMTIITLICLLFQDYCRALYVTILR